MTTEICIDNWEKMRRYAPNLYNRLSPCQEKTDAAAVLCAYEIGYDDGQNDPVRWIDRYTVEYNGRVYRLRELLKLADRLQHTGQPIGKDLQYSHNEK